MPLPFFCVVCDKPINPSPDKKYSTIHEKCMSDYLKTYNYTKVNDFNKNLSITDLPKKPKK